MRVISGIAKGKRLYTPKGLDIRPTSDRVKESMFNIIGPHLVENAEIIDIFAGTGSLGIEALSRGAKHAYFIDSKREAIELIFKNLEATGLKEKATVISMDADKAVKRLLNEGVTADMIFLDPPYRISVSFLDAVINNLASQILKADGLLFLEHASKSESRVIESLDIESVRKYGDTAVTIYKRKGF